MNDADLCFASPCVCSQPAAPRRGRSTRFVSAPLRMLVIAGATLSSLVLTGCTGPTETGTATASAIATVEAFEGEAAVVREQQRVLVGVGMTLSAGDRLETGAQGKMRVRMRDQSVLAIGAGTKLALAELAMDGATRSGRIDVALGRFWMNVTKWTGSGASRYEIHTPNAVAGVRGTTLWGDTAVDAICALEGTIEVRSLEDSSLAPATLSAGNCASALSEGKLAPLSPTSEQIQKYLDEVLIRTK